MTAALIAAAHALPSVATALPTVRAALIAPPAADGARAFWVEAPDGRTGWGATLDHHTLTGFRTAEAALSAVRRAARVTAPMGLCE